MRWKLANGNVVASSKQPVQWKDFDRIEISDNYENYLDENGPLEESGLPATGDIELEVILYNPSTHTIRKSYHKPGVQIHAGPVRRFGTTGGRYTQNKPEFCRQDYRCVSHKYNLDYGDTSYFYLYPIIISSESAWNREISPWNVGPYNYDHDDWNQRYDVRFVIKTNGGKREDYKIMCQKTHYIKYKVR